MADALGVSRPALNDLVDAHPREPLPDRLSWETERVDRYNRFDWLIIDRLGHVGTETRFESNNTIARGGRTRAIFPQSAQTGRVDLTRSGNSVAARTNGVRAFTLLLSPSQFDFTKPVKFDKSAYLHSLPAEPVDVIVIDGSEAWVPVRPICFQLAEQRMRPGGLIVVDDSWRYPELRVENRARRVRTFKSVGPGRPGVTTTDVFCY